MTREEHLAWAKKRALEYLDAGDTKNAFGSMTSDIRKHPELQDHAGVEIGIMMAMAIPGWASDPKEIRNWIVGFN